MTTIAHIPTPEKVLALLQQNGEMDSTNRNTWAIDGLGTE